MLPCEFESVPLGVHSDDSRDNLANSLIYVRKVKRRSRIRSLSLKNVRVMCLVHQQSQCFVEINLVESFEAESGNISCEVRKLLLEILEFLLL